MKKIYDKNDLNYLKHEVIFKPFVIVKIQDERIKF